VPSRKDRLEKIMQRPMSELTDEQAEQAAILARIAERAEAKAASRARAKAVSSNDKPGSAAHSSNGRTSDGAALQDKKAVLSLDEMVALKKAEKAAANKVVFLTKAQRREEAMARMEAKRAELQKQREEARRQRAEFLRTGGGGNATGGHRARSRDGRRRDGAEHNRFAEAPRAPAAGRNTNDAAAPENTFEHRQQIKAIKELYLGTKKKKKKIMKPSEKFARIFQFDWESTDDTSQDLNPLYQQRANVSLAFGRGYRAGVDMRAQRKKNTYMTDLTKFRQQQQREEEKKRLSRAELQEAERKRQAELQKVQEQQKRIAQAMDVKIARDKGKHWSDKALTEMTERDWRIFREDFDIRIQGGHATNPLRSWSESSLDERILKAFADMKFENPSPIQRQAIPIGVQNRDIIGIAETGSGKTAAFVAPMLQYIAKCPSAMRLRTPTDGPLAIIMAPTRELAQQIEEETVKIARHMQVSVVSMIGGQSINDQGFKMRKGCDILIATPGRVLDALENRFVVLNQCNYIVLDEADRMIDMGFEDSVNKIMDSMGSLLKAEAEEDALEQAKKSALGVELYRVTSLYSATMPAEVERLAKKYLRSPCIIRIGDEDSGKNMRIEQRVVFVSTADKKKKLTDTIEKFKRDYVYAEGEKDEGFLRTIVFVNQKKSCDSVARTLSAAGLFPIVLHGGKSQDAREYALSQFKEGEFDTLVATDVAGRGLDIPDVKHVINYDMSSDIEKYTHRIGRTGRAGKSGVSTTFLTEDDEEVFYDLKQYLKNTNATIPRELDSHPAANSKPGEFGAKRSKRETVQYVS